MNNDVSIIKNAKKAWIFQWNPDEYDTINDFIIGKEKEYWRVNAHWNRMSKGDLVLLWKTRAGKGKSTGEAGIYGIATLLDEPWEAAPDDVCKYWVTIKYLFLLPVPLTKSVLEQNSQFKPMALRVSRGTNFRVEPSEWNELRTTLLFQGESQKEIVQKNGVPDRHMYRGIRLYEIQKWLES
ncbi:MAG TPA: hypothetical protein DDY49_00335 [Paenibacillaceae bacterium]|nr:hypothetical protein [Paenibacillaceae bacterium]